MLSLLYYYEIGVLKRYIKICKLLSIDLIINSKNAILTLIEKSVLSDQVEISKKGIQIFLIILRNFYNKKQNGISYDFLEYFAKN